MESPHGEIKTSKFYSLVKLCAKRFRWGYGGKLILYDIKIDREAKVSGNSANRWTAINNGNYKTEWSLGESLTG